MKIQELVLKNFGKFTEKKIQVSDGIQIFYGENEAGKSTVHTFIRGMLFGMERGRGRASVNDTFSIYEPWENPNYYSGMLRFESGGKRFCMQRNFDKFSKKAELICEDDGEKLSVDDGDLDVILEGLTPQIYDNTISIRQMKAETDTSLAVTLKNFATNYYVAGDGDMDLSAALGKLQGRLKEIDREINDGLVKKQNRRERIEQESSYVWRDLHKLREEKAYLAEEIAFRRKKEAAEQEEESGKGIMDGLRSPKWRIHPVEILVFAIIIILACVVIEKPWNYLLAIIIFLACGIYVWNRMKVGKRREKTEPEKLLEEIMPEEEKIPLQKLIWESERVEEELRDKEIRYSNLQEQLEELEEMTDEFKEQDRSRVAVQFAITKLGQLSGQMQNRLEQRLNATASEILEAITGGRYTRLVADENLKMSLLSGGRNISLAQVSRGTIEQVYFALRMAAAQLLQEEEYPVILDDTFVYYDDERLENTLRWLYENKKQVLIFTCQRREKEALARLQIPYGEEIL